MFIYSNHEGVKSTENDHKKIKLKKKKNQHTSNDKIKGINYTTYPPPSSINHINLIGLSITPSIKSLLCLLSPSLHIKITLPPSQNKLGTLFSQMASVVDRLVRWWCFPWRRRPPPNLTGS